MLTDNTEGGAFLYLFSRFRFGFCVVPCDDSDGVDSAETSPWSNEGSIPGYDMYYRGLSVCTPRIIVELLEMLRTTDSIGLVGVDGSRGDSGSWYSDGNEFGGSGKSYLSMMRLPICVFNQAIVLASVIEWNHYGS